MLIIDNKKGCDHLFIQEREDILGKNEMFILSVLEILEQKHHCNFMGESQGIVTVKADEKDESFSAIVNDDTIGITKINGTPCKLFIRIKDGRGRLINKDLGLKLQYSIEELENDIQKISIIQNMNNNTFFQSYLYKNEDALIIGYLEKIDKLNLPKDTKPTRDFTITIENNNLVNASEEEIQDYAETWALGVKSKNGRLFYEQSEEENFADKELNDDKIDELDDNIYDEEQFLEDFESEEDEEDIAMEEFDNIIVKENGKVLDEESSDEMVCDIYEELLENDIYVNESVIAEIENIFNQLQDLFKLRAEKNKGKDLNR